MRVLLPFWLLLTLGLWACGDPADGETSGGATDDPLAAGTPEERAMVRALLDSIAAEHGPEDVTDQQIEQLWESRFAGQPLPARVPVASVEDELREELVARARLQALVELVAELEQRHGVERDQAAIEALATLPIVFEEEP